MEPRQRSNLIGLLAAAALTCLGCVHPIGEGTSAIGEVLRDCLVPLPQGVASLGAPVALEYPNGSLWIWSRIELLDGRVIDNASAFVTSAQDVCAHGPSLMSDVSATPSTMLALTDSERTENASRMDGRQLRLIPVSGFVEADRGYLFYEHTWVGPGVFDAEVIGTGLCLRGEDSSVCERIAVGGDTILWRAHVRMLNRGGLVVDGRALVYGCRTAAAFTAICTVAGTPLDHLTDPDAYQLWNSFAGWVDLPAQASSLTDEVGPWTVSSYRGKFLMTVLDVFQSRVYFRRADSATGEFGRRIVAFDIVPPASGFPGGGREHSGLRREDRTIHLSYSSTGERAPGLHLATFRIFGEFGERP